jgi:hypothetical protein
MNEHTKTCEFALPTEGARITRLMTGCASVRGFIEAILEAVPATVLGRKQVPPAKR